MSVALESEREGDIFMIAGEQNGYTRGLLAAFGVMLGLGSGVAQAGDGPLPNNFPFLNRAGTAATFSTAGSVDLGNAFHVPQGTNGRSCESCHLVQVGWS